MKRQREREENAEFEDPDFAEIVIGDEPGRKSSSRRVQRKTQQFCRQVQRALNVALAEWDPGDAGLDLFVEEVSPAPDCGHLLVRIGIADGGSVLEAMQAIRSHASRLRAEVAMAIVRKRAPQLSFAPVAAVPVWTKGGGDD